MALDMGGAAGGALMLQDVLKRKMLEAYQNAQIQSEQASLAERAREANMQNDVQQGNLTLGRRRVGLDEAQFAEGNRRYQDEAPLRAVNIRLHAAQAGNAEHASAEAQKGRDFQAAQLAARLAFEGKEGAVNRANARELAGMRIDAAAAKGTPNAAQQQNEVQDTLSLIDQISKDPALAASVGQLNSHGLGYLRDPSGNTRFGSLHDQLVGKMSLAQAGKLKGQGQISDKERAMLAAAATALNKGLQESDYRAELGKVRGQFERMMNPAAAGANIADAQEFDYVPGKGLVPRGK